MRYPVEPLMALAGMSGAALCELAGMADSTIRAAKARGGLTEKSAERLAVAANLSPYDVWPEMLDHNISASEIACADPACGNRFVPSRKNHVYCSRLCTVRVANRNYRARHKTNPDFQQRRREQEQAYLAASERARRVKRALHYQANRDRMLLKAKIRDHYRRGHEDRGCPAGCPLNTEVAA